MTVLLHSSPQSPSGSGRWSVTAMCPVPLTAVSGSGVLSPPGVADVGEVVHDVFAYVGDADGDPNGWAGIRCP